MLARRTDQGFTMVELMVVVAIIGITAALTIRSFTKNPTGESARKVAAMMATANRTAISGGPVRSDCVDGLGNPIKARAQLEFIETSGQVLVNVYVVVEDPLPLHTAPWVLVSSEILSPDTEVTAVMGTAGPPYVPLPIDPGTAPPLMTLPTSAPGLIKLYNPDGTADPMAVFLKHRTNNTATRYRVLGLPINPVPQVFQDW